MHLQVYCYSNINVLCTPVDGLTDWVIKNYFLFVDVVDVHHDERGQ